MADNSFDWPDESIDEVSDQVDSGLLFDETTLPPDHRSGFVAVIGRPNVGKSTLMNTYLGQKVAIVSSKAQTTRNRLLGILTRPDAQIVFMDTPGIHEPHHKFGEFMVETAIRTLTDADVILWLVDGSSQSTPADHLVVQAIERLKTRPPLIMVMNKVDAMAQGDIPGQLENSIRLSSSDQQWAISALTGHNCPDLLAAIIDYLPFGPRFFPEDQITDQYERFSAAEMIREAALAVLHQEVPHALAIEIDEFKERSQNMTYINAILNVERESQKPIVIGQRGRTLKRIGQLARTQIEEMLETKVYLELRVKVRPNWRKKEKELHGLGYSLE